MSENFVPHNKKKLKSSGFSQQQTLRQGFECEWFIVDGVPGNTGRGVENRNKGGKTTNKRSLTRQVTTLRRRRLMPLGSSGSP